MRFNRKMTEAEFSLAMTFCKNLGAELIEIARDDLVKGLPQETIAQAHDMTKSAVSKASRKIWLGFLRSKGYEEITVVLPNMRAHTARKWAEAAMKEVNLSSRP